MFPRALLNRLNPCLRISASRSLSGVSESKGMIHRMNVQDFARILQDDKSTSGLRAKYQIVDVREPVELEIAAIKGSDVINLPLSTASTWASKVIDGEVLDKTKPTLSLCHHGRRSMQMAHFLVHQAGFTEVHNIEGGIDAYSAECDKTIAKY